MAGEDTYTFGQCTWYVARTLWWVQGGWHNATDWAVNAARAGFRLTLQPTVGAVVVYGAGDGYSEFGHVAIVMEVYSAFSFLVSEMNFTAWDTVDERVSNMHDVSAFILPPGVEAGAGTGVATGGGSSTPDAVRMEWQGLMDWLNSGADTEIRKLQQQYDLFWKV